MAAHVISVKVMTTAALNTGVWPLFRELVSLTKPRVSLLVLLTAAAGMGLAHHAMALSQIVAMQLGMVLIVGCANALNCWIERDSDALMERTSNRALPAGRLSPHAALGFACLLGAVSVPLLTLLVNPLTGLLGVLALLLYVGAYTPLKSRTPAALIIGAVPGALPPLMGVTAATGRMDGLGLALFGILFLWQMPHVIGLSCYRKADYERAGIKVLPLVRGDRVAKWHALLWAISLLPVSLALPSLGAGSTLYTIFAWLLGLAYVGLTLRGFQRDSGAVWGRRLFLGSLLYLPLLFAALLLDSAV